MLLEPFEIFLMICLVGIVAAISYVDFKSFRIPDHLNIALVVLGLAYVIQSPELELAIQILSSACLFIALYSIRFVYERLRNQTGLGLGDVKMVGSAAIWLTPHNIPYLILIASGGALIFVFAMRVFKDISVDAELAVPFGPFIGLALILVWTGQIFDVWKLGIGL